MEQTRLTIPPIPEFRHHLVLVLHYCHAVLLLTDRGDIKSAGFEKLIDKDMLDALLARLAPAIEDEGKIAVTFEEIVMMYTCFDLMSKILVSEYDSLITDMAPDDDGETLPDFAEIRDRLLPVNVHLLQDTMAKFPDNEELIKRKQLLADMLV